MLPILPSRVCRDPTRSMSRAADDDGRAWNLGPWLCGRGSRAESTATDVDTPAVDRVVCPGCAQAGIGARAPAGQRSL